VVARSEGEELLVWELKANRIPFEREVPVCADRNWRFDFVLPDVGSNRPHWLAVEIDGGAYSGGHRRGAAADSECEKMNRAAMDGWTVLHFTPAMVRDGRAIVTIKETLGGEWA